MFSCPITTFFLYWSNKRCVGAWNKVMKETLNIVLTYNFAHGLLKSDFDIELARPLGKGELRGHIHRQCNHTEEMKQMVGSKQVTQR